MKKIKLYLLVILIPIFYSCNTTEVLRIEYTLQITYMNGDVDQFKVIKKRYKNELSWFSLIPEGACLQYCDETNSLHGSIIACDVRRYVVLSKKKLNN